MSWPWHNSGDQRPVFICNVYSPKSRLLRRRAVTPPSAPAGSCWAANPSRSARLCSSSARSMVTKYYCSRSFVHFHSTAGLLLERGYAGKGMVQEDLLGLPHPRSRLGMAGLLYPGCATSLMFLMSPSAYFCFYSLQLRTKVLVYLRRKNAGKANWRRLRFLKTEFWLSVFSVTFEVWLYLLARLGNLIWKVDCRWIINLHLI